MEREWLHAALEALRGRGLIAYPSERSHLWDGRAHPVLPKVITRVEARLAAHESWRSHPWHPRLAWVPTLARLTRDQEFFLRRVHEGLVEGWFERPAPLRYRSLQLTGWEKRLEAHMGTTLFGEGRLSVELLGFYTVVLPLAWERVQAGGRVIAFENKEPFIVARAVLQALVAPPYDIVAFGGGRGFEQSVEHLCTIGCPITRLDYVGDLDEPGLDIAARAAEIVRRSGGLPHLRPAPGMHAMMLQAAERFGHAGGWPDPESRKPASPEAITWIPDQVRITVERIVRSGRRIPEEVLGPEEMRKVWAGGT
jgi:hypothetical protein